MSLNKFILILLKPISFPRSKLVIKKEFSGLARVVKVYDQGLAKRLNNSEGKPSLLMDKILIPKSGFLGFSTDHLDSNIQGTFNMIEYEKLVENTLQNLAEFIDETLESADNLTDTDVSLSDGILKVFLSEQYGTYVINKQTPNRQIWFSSPISGPLRFDYVDNQWIYKRTGVTLQGILSQEFSKVLEKKVDFPQV